jgi:WD40 repeat protein
MSSSAILKRRCLFPGWHPYPHRESFPFFAARLWETATGKLRRTFLGHAWLVNAVTFSPNGQWVLTGSDSVRLWDIRDLLTL